jgi:hypothetical protein
MHISLPNLGVESSLPLKSFGRLIRNLAALHAEYAALQDFLAKSGAYFSMTR